MDEKRSVGIIVLGRFFIFAGILLFLYYTLSILDVYANVRILPLSFPLFFIPFGKTAPYAIINTFIEIYFLLFIFAGWRVINFNNSGRKLIILLLSIPLVYIFTVFNPWGLAQHQYFGRFCQPAREVHLSTKVFYALVTLVIELAINLPFLILIYYLTRPKVKERFK